MATKEETRRLLVSYQAANSGAKASGVASDAALGGLFIETQTPFPIGTLLTVELSSPSTAVTLEARVFSIRQREGHKPAGMAVSFLDLPQRTIWQLQLILDFHRPPARTRMGVGDEREALWASAGGRDEGESAPIDWENVPAIAVTSIVENDAKGKAPLPARVPPPAPQRAPAVARAEIEGPPQPAVVWTQLGARRGQSSFPPPAGTNAPSWHPPPSGPIPGPILAAPARGWSRLAIVLVLLAVLGLLATAVVAIASYVR